MLDARDTERITASVTLAPDHNHTVTNVITNCGGCFESAHLAQSLISNGPFNDGMAAVDHSSILTAFEEGHGDMSANLMDTGSEMCRLGFFQPSTGSEGYQLPSHDIDSFLTPIENTTGLTPISESISIADASSCSCCSSTGRPESSSARFSSTGPSTASLADTSTRKMSPADIPEIFACQCLDQALQLLKTVSGSSRMSSSSSPSSSSSFSSSAHSHYSSQPSQVVSRMSSTTPNADDSSTGFGAIETQPQWFQATLSENRQCLGTMENILACSSTDEDSMLLIFLCMILLKILGRYSDVAFSQPPLSHNRGHDIAELGSNMSGYLIVETGLVASTIYRHTFVSNELGQIQHIHLDSGTSQYSDDERFGRSAAHLVLGELHWVQRVVNKLLARLKCPDCYNTSRSTQQSCGWESRQQRTPLTMEELADPGLSSSFSSSTLEHMAIDIQKRLTTLSSSIVNRLRQS